ERAVLLASAREVFQRRPYRPRPDRVVREAQGRVDRRGGEVARPEPRVRDVGGRVEVQLDRLRYPLLVLLVKGVAEDLRRVLLPLQLEECRGLRIRVVELPTGRMQPVR